MLVCSGPLSVLPGNSNTLRGWGPVKEDVNLTVMWLNVTSSALRLICRHWCSLKNVSLLSVLGTDLCPAAHCPIRSCFKKKQLWRSQNMQSPPAFLLGEHTYDSTKKFTNSCASWLLVWWWNCLGRKGAPVTTGVYFRMILKAVTLTHQHDRVSRNAWLRSWKRLWAF